MSGEDEPARSDGAEISLITGTIGRLGALEALAESLGDQDLPLEWILVDQSGGDEVERFAAAVTLPGFRYLRDGSRGIARARNLGLSAARAPIVGFPDDDCRLPQGVLARVLREFRGTGADGIVGRIAENPAAAGPERPARPLSRYFYPSQSAALFLRRELIEALGGFDETLGAGAGTEWGAGEETDLVMRAMRGGARLVHVPGIVIEHGETVTSPEKAVAYGRGAGRVLRRNGYPFAYVALRAAKAFLLGSAARLRGDARTASIRTAWARGALAGFRARP